MKAFAQQRKPQSKKTTHIMGENICIWNDRQGNDLQDIQIVHVAHY